MRNTTQLQTLFSNAAADGRSISLRVTDWAIITLKIKTSGNAQADILTHGTIDNSQNPPSLIVPLIKLDDYATGNTVNGNTGVQVGGADIDKVYNVSVDGLDWIQIEIANYLAGNITVEAKMFNND